MILITGAAGLLGRATIDALLTKLPASQIAGLVRDKAKATDLAEKGITLLEGDYHDYDSLVKAFNVIDKILLISAHGFTDRVTQHKNVINAAKQAGVKHLVYTSIQRSNDYVLAEVTESDQATEDYLKASGIAYTILGNNTYLDGISFLLGPNVLTEGVKVPAGDGKTAFITRKDIAAATAEILTGEGHRNKSYFICGSESYTFGEVAQVLSELSGKTIAYTSVSAEEFVKLRSAEGLPEPFAAFLAAWAVAIEKGLFASTDGPVEQLISKKTTTLKEFLKSAYFPAK